MTMATQRRLAMMAVLLMSDIRIHSGVSAANTGLRGANARENADPVADGEKRRGLYGLEYGVEGFQSIYGDAEDRPDKFQTNPNAPKDVVQDADATTTESEEPKDADDVDVYAFGSTPYGGFPDIDGIPLNMTAVDEMETKIINGRRSRYQPAFVMLLREDGVRNGRQLYNNIGCGGALVSPCHVVTAAHCNIHPINARFYGVCVGCAAPWDGNYNGARVIRGKTEIKSFVNHPNYDRRGNDIAVITLENCVDDRFQPMDIAEPNFMSKMDADTDMLTPTVMGFGRTSETNPALSTRLMEAEVPHIPTDTCKAYYENFDRRDVTDDQICAGFPQGGTDGCQGDSGGPLVVNADNKWKITLTGVTSWGHGCARSGFPGVYTEAAWHYKWLQEQVCGDNRLSRNGYRTKFMKSCTGDHSPDFSRISSGNKNNGSQSASKTAPSPTEAPTSSPTPSPTPNPTPNPTPAPVRTRTTSCRRRGATAYHSSKCCSGKLKNNRCL